MRLDDQHRTARDAASRPRRARLISSLAAIATLPVSAGSLVSGPVTAAHAAVASAAVPAKPMWSTQLDFDDNGVPWSQASFAALRADGLTTAEIDMPWNTIEPSQGSFSFSELDTELANASAAGIRLVLIFWYSGWGGSPASWVTSHEVSSSGAQAAAPAWWDLVAEPAYVTYVTDTIRHAAHKAGYGGSVLDYGFLDAQWDNGSGGASGWAPADVSEFHDVYLPRTYKTIAAFNAANQTSYTAFSQVPAATPGQPLASVYQQFRAWSVQAVYNQLTSRARAVTPWTPLYYYFGGHVGDAANYANIPDLFFGLARQYTVTVIEDAAQSPGLALLFGSLGRAYGVRVAMEWTAPGDNTQLAAQAVQWIDNYGMALPEGGGEDFFIHDGTQKDTVGFPIYINYLQDIRSLHGSYPQQPVAVYIDYSQAYGNASGGSLGAPENNITSLWDSYQAGFDVITSQEVDSGLVSLSRFKAVLPVNGMDANLSAYAVAGGTVLTAGSQMSQYAPAYASLANSTAQVVPVVSPGAHRAQLTLTDITSGTAYDDSVTISPAGLGLATGTYHVVDASGTIVPQQTVAAGICAEADIPAASLAQWSVVPGPAPPGTAAPSNCADSTPVPCGTLPANHELLVNQSITSCNGDYRLIMQGDGNLVLYTSSGTPLWASNTSGSAADEAIMQADGNLVLYTSTGSLVWSSGTAGNAGAYLVVGNDGNVIIYSASGSVLWSTGT